MPALQNGSQGDDVKRLQQALKQKGFYNDAVNGAFDAGTEAAVKAFQASQALKADGVAGPITKAALGIIVPPGPDVTGSVTVDNVVSMLTGTSRANVTKHLPNILAALRTEGLVDRWMILMTLSTIYVETGQFDPIPEGISQYNTSPDGAPFDLYNGRMGNGPDGARFKGRGFIQLTGHDNYRDIGNAIGVDLLSDPDRALDSVVASEILARFLKRAETAIRVALAEKNLADARRAVNGGSYGLTEFKSAYGRGEPIFPAPMA